MNPHRLCEPLEAGARPVHPILVTSPQRINSGAIGRLEKRTCREALRRIRATRLSLAAQIAKDLPSMREGSDSILAPVIPMALPLSGWRQAGHGRVIYSV